MDTSFQHDPELPGICPHCGGDIGRPKLIEDGPFCYDPETNTFTVGGQRLEAQPKSHAVLGTLMRAKGRVLTVGFVSDAIGYEPRRDTTGDYSERAFYVHLHSARKAILRLGLMFPVETIPGEMAGYRWNRNAEVRRKTTKHRLQG